MPIIMETTPTPPKRISPTKAAATARVEKAQAEVRQRRIDAVNSIGSLFHMALLAARQPADAAAVNRHVPPISAAIVDYAEGNENFASGLDKLSDVSPLAGIAMAVAPLVMQIAVNHNLLGLKAEQVASAGVVSKETLVAETNTYLMDIQRQAMQKQMEAEQKLMAAHAEWVEHQRIKAEAESANASPE